MLQKIHKKFYGNWLINGFTKGPCRQFNTRYGYLLSTRVFVNKFAQIIFIIDLMIEEIMRILMIRHLPMFQHTQFLRNLDDLKKEIMFSQNSTCYQWLMY